MLTSRKLVDLHPKVAAMAMQHVADCREENIDLLITCTFRDKEAQDALFAQGRTAPGKIVTRARAGQSMHNFRLAYDVVPLINGKPCWDVKNPVWLRVGELGKKNGLEWAGDWKTFKEYPHFQYTGGLTIADLQKGVMI